MGIRFRKSVKIAPGVKLNLNKKSTSVTFGAKGAHYTMSSNGTRTKSASIPGTGISYVETSKSKRNTDSSSFSNGTSTSGKTPKKKGPLTYVLIAFAVFVVLAAIGSMNNSEEITAEWQGTTFDVSETTEVTIASDPSDLEIESLELSDNDIATLTYTNGKAIISFKSAGTASLTFIANGDIESESQEITVTDNTAAQAAAQKAADEEAARQKAEQERIAQEQAQKAEQERIAQEKAAAEKAEQERIAKEKATTQQTNKKPSSSTQPQGEMVWISKTGSKYHSNPNCSNMNNPSQISLSDAKAKGKTPCKNCYH